MLNLTLHNEQEAVTIRSFTEQAITIDQTAYEQSLILSRSTVKPVDGLTSIADLSDDLADQLLVDHPEVVLIGTGPTHCFPQPSFLGKILSSGSGCEVMTTAAGCRTHNILASEGRRVVSLLIMPGQR